MCALFLLTFGISSCDKVDFIPHSEDEPEACVERAPEVVIGATEKMTIQQHATTLIGDYYSPVSFGFDMDADGSDDIGIESSQGGSQAVGTIPFCRILSLNPNAQILGVMGSDTVFLNIDYREVPGAETNKVVFGNFHTYTCEQISERDTVIRISPRFKVKPLREGDLMNGADDYSADTLTLRQSGHNGHGDGAYYELNDTIVYYSSISLGNCFDFPQEEAMYIGVRLNGTCARMGWIKLAIRDDYKVSIMETAVQE